jgi:iron complex transport system ATP-binding protein
VLALEQVSFAFAPGAAPVLRRVDLRVEPGELVCVVGPNGAGKTTLIRIAAGLLSPLAGRARIGGIDPAAARRDEVARHLAYLPQHYDLVFPFTVAEVVLFGRYAHGRRGLAGYATTAADRKIAEAAMERCDVGALAGRRWDELSGGERRRALLAQAFCQDAGLLVLDEPTAALDPAHAVSVFETLRDRIRERGAAVAVTHDLNLAARFADRVVLLHRGEIVADGPPPEVLGGDAAAAAFAIALHLGAVPGDEIPFAVPGRRTGVP